MIGEALVLYPSRPRTRGECGTERPCPWVSCKWHLAIDVTPSTGRITINQPRLLRWLDGECAPPSAPTCALDLADSGRVTLEEIAWTTDLSRERARQIESEAMRKIGRKRGLLDLLG